MTGKVNPESVDPPKPRSDICSVEPEFRENKKIGTGAHDFCPTRLAIVKPRNLGRSASRWQNLSWLNHISIIVVYKIIIEFARFQEMSNPWISPHNRLSICHISVENEFSLTINYINYVNYKLYTLTKGIRLYCISIGKLVNSAVTAIQIFSTGQMSSKAIKLN